MKKRGSGVDLSADMDSSSGSGDSIEHFVVDVNKTSECRHEGGDDQVRGEREDGMDS